MKHYPALLDQGNGVYGVVFPDLPGVAAVGDTVEEALENAVEALRDYVDAMEEDGFDYAPPSDLFDIDVPAGNVATLVPLVRPSGEKVEVAQA